MNDFLALTISLAGGFGAGVIFFGGLWLTVRRLDRLRYPGVVFLLSSVARLALVLAVFWWLSRDGLPQLALCLTGFIIARFVLIRTVRKSAPAEPPLPSKEM
jgi:F1F0 ATPase subunit 2